MSDFDATAVGQYRLHALIEPVRKVFVAVIEDGEGCGMIEMSVHATLEGATQALREMVDGEYYFEDDEEVDLSTMDADEIRELIEDRDGKTAKIEQHEVRA